MELVFNPSVPHCKEQGAMSRGEMSSEAMGIAQCAELNGVTVEEGSSPQSLRVFTGWSDRTQE